MPSEPAPIVFSTDPRPSGYIAKTMDRAANAPHVVVVGPQRNPALFGRIQLGTGEPYGLAEAHIAKLVLEVNDGLVTVVKSTLSDDVAPGDSWLL